MKFSGQATVEYLILIVVVVILSLVIVGLGNQIFNSGSQVPEESARATWKSAQPWAIVDWTMESDGILSLVLKNMSYETLALNSFNLTAGDLNNTPASVYPGETYTLTVIPSEYLVGCPTGEKFNFDKSGITINFTSKNLPNMIEKGVENITGTCS